MSERKDTNPKDAIGIAKVPASTVPREVIAEVGLAMMEGALKYGRHNFRDAGVRYSVYYDAMTRHIDAFHEGQDIDPESGLSHLVKAIACLVVLRDSQFLGNWVDDRPPKLPDNWQADLNAKAAALLEKYPNPRPAHVELKAEAIEHPSTVPTLQEEWTRQYRWHGGFANQDGSRDVYAHRDGKWMVSRGEDGDPSVSLENASPGAYGPYTRINP